jgi:hypothetical protein
MSDPHAPWRLATIFAAMREVKCGQPMSLFAAIPLVTQLGRVRLFECTKCEKLGFPYGTVGSPVPGRVAKSRNTRLQRPSGSSSPTLCDKHAHSGVDRLCEESAAIFGLSRPPTTRTVGLNSSALVGGELASLAPDQLRYLPLW